MSILTVEPIIKSEYSQSEVMARKIMCSVGVFYLSPLPKLLTSNAPYGSEMLLDSIDGDTMSEITEYLSSYSEKALVIDMCDHVLAVLPSLYPSSSLGVLLRFDMKIGAFWRLVGLCEAEDIFLCSDLTKKAPSRLSKEMREQENDFRVLCDEIRDCFFSLDGFSHLLSTENKQSALIEQCLNLSRFVGCPISVSVAEEEKSDAPFELTDFPLFTSFVLTMLISARNDALDRSARITLTPQFSSVTVSVEFDNFAHTGSDCYLSRWKHVSYDKNMLFDVFKRDGKTVVRFNPCRAEWSRLGLKQRQEHDV